MTLADAKWFVESGFDFGDVFPEVVPTDRDAFRRWFCWELRRPKDYPVPPRSTAGTDADRRRQSRQMGYSGEECPHCRSMALRYSGTCLICDVCQQSTGCS